MIKYLSSIVLIGVGCWVWVEEGSPLIGIVLIVIAAASVLAIPAPSPRQRSVIMFREE